MPPMSMSQGSTKGQDQTLTKPSLSTIPISFSAPEISLQGLPLPSIPS